MIPIGLYRGERVKDNNKPYVFLKPPSDVKLSMRDRIFVLSGKQPKETDDNQGLSMGNLGHQNPTTNQFTFKSKLHGEEGRVDLEFARELWKFKNRMSQYREQLVAINQVNFNQGLI